MVDGRRVERYERKTPADYSFDRATVAAMVRRIGAETGITIRRVS